MALHIRNVYTRHKRLKQALGSSMIAIGLLADYPVHGEQYYIAFTSAFGNGNLTFDTDHVLPLLPPDFSDSLGEYIDVNGSYTFNGYSDYGISLYLDNNSGIGSTLTICTPPDFHGFTLYGFSQEQASSTSISDAVDLMNSASITYCIGTINDGGVHVPVDSISITAIPEPSTSTLFGSILGGLGAVALLSRKPCKRNLGTGAPGVHQ